MTMKPKFDPTTIADGFEEEDDDDEDDDENDEEDEDADGADMESGIGSERAKTESLFRRLWVEKVPLRVHDVLIKGNTKTKNSLIESEVESLKHATCLQELFQAASIAGDRLRRLGVFDYVTVTLDSGPPEFPGSANVVVEVVESIYRLNSDISVFSKTQARPESFKGSLELKNLFGYGDVWHFSVGWDQIGEVSAGVYAPRFKGWVTPMVARVSFLWQDWLKFSSYQNQALGLSFGLISLRNQDLSYNLCWQALADPSLLSSRRQLGHGFLSSLKYVYKIDRRNSTQRPSSGYALVSTSQIGSLIPDYQSLCFFHKEFDIQYALSLGFCNAALKFGISGGVFFQLGSGITNKPSPTRKFFLGGNSSSVCSLGGSMSVLGFELRGLGLTDPGRSLRGNSNGASSDTTSESNSLGGDLAVTACTDLSFDLPFGLLKNSGIFGHAFACTGSLTRLTKNAFQDLTFQKFHEAFRSSGGFGIIIPTKLFLMEVNYCSVLKPSEHGRWKTGFQFGFSSPL